MIVEIKELSTGFIIPKPRKDFRFYKVENFFSSLNPRTREYEPFGILEDDNSYRIGKVNYETLDKLMGEFQYNITKIPNTPYSSHTTEMKMKNQPKDEIQAEVINNCLKAFNSGEERVVVSLPTGRGKTYVATNIISRLKTPTIIFIKNVNLRDQWLESFYKHSTLKNIAFVTGSADLVHILETNQKYDVIMVIHRSLQNFVDLVGPREFNRLLIQQGIGLKVFDEFDMEASSTFKIETYTSVAKTLYMSATDFKSPNCDKVFQAVYGHLPNYGKEYEIVVERNGLFIIHNSKPSKPEFGKCHSFTKMGFTFDYQKYHKYIVDKKSYKEPLKLLWDKMLKNKFYNREHFLKVVFFIGRKVTAEEFKKDLSDIFGVDLNEISIVNSDIPEKQRKINENFKLIVSTADSMGRGKDLEGIDTVIDFETRASISKTIQVIGRVSRSGSKVVGTYVNFVDIAFPTVLRNYEYKMGSGFYEKQLTKIKILNLTKNDNK